MLLCDVASSVVIGKTYIVMDVVRPKSMSKVVADYDPTGTARMVGKRGVTDWTPIGQPKQRPAPATVNAAQQAPVAAPPTVTAAPAVQSAPPLLPPQMTPVGQTVAPDASQTLSGTAPQSQSTVASALTREQLN